MIRHLFGAFAIVATLAGCAASGATQTDQQSLVDRSTLALQEMFAPNQNPQAVALLKKAKAVMVCPRIFKASFIVGGSGGGCVLVGRSATGATGPAAWSGPAFYGIGSGSFGLQAGVQDSEVVLVVETDKGLRSLLDSHFKFGADAGVAVAAYGAGVQGAVTPALTADIVAFSSNRGLFAGVALDGSVLSTRSEWNQSYYGQALSAQQIVLNFQGNNPGDAPLKAMLAHIVGE
ncbi:MAG: lipid-binding SYLF domain-containing protein [Rhodospirillales bacterium]|nr:lipid-binding SYLF domain-containing protein [Rhodospirillales bacterium]